MAKGIRWGAQEHALRHQYCRRSHFCPFVVASAQHTPDGRERAVPSQRTFSTSIVPGSSPEVHKWTEGYSAQAALPLGADAAAACDATPFILPIMGLKKVKLPTDTVQLQSEGCSWHSAVEFRTKSPFCSLSPPLCSFRAAVPVDVQVGCLLNSVRC